MSKTPRTDKEAFDITTGKPDIGGVVMADFARELEIELNEQVLLNGKGSEREYSLLGKIERLERENAALRKDKERLDLLNTLRQYYSRPPLRKVSGWAWSIVDEREERTGDIRDTIDAIQNKTENDKITYHKGPEFMASGVAVVHTFKP